jgi:hypothetical protein
MSEMLDPTFYRSPADAVAAPPERLAYVAAFDPAGRSNDAMTVIDCDPSSPDYGRVVGWSELPTTGNELHHFGWNACSSALCHQGHGDHGEGGLLERRYLIVLGLRSSRTYVLDTKPDPRNPKVVRTIEADELAAKAGYSVPPLISDIDLSVDDRWLYVSCWGTGELKQYDVSDPFNPRETGSVKLGGIVRRHPHPAAPELPLGGGPQMVEVSRDGRRVYVTNSIYATWDDIFYPDGVGAWAAKLDANLDGGGLAADARFFPHADDFRGLRVHQTRLEGGDASSDSYCHIS